MAPTLRPYIFNLHGWFNGVDFVNTLFDCSDILCLQEHWLCLQSLNYFDSVNFEFKALSVSTMNNDVFMIGRPYERLVIVCKSCAVKILNRFLECINKKSMAVLVEYYDSKILVFSTYFPCKGDPAYQTEVDILCRFKESVINEIALSNIRIFVAGDFNENLVNIDKLPVKFFAKVYGFIQSKAMLRVIIIIIIIIINVKFVPPPFTSLKGAKHAQKAKCYNRLY